MKFTFIHAVYALTALVCTAECRRGKKRGFSSNSNYFSQIFRDSFVSGNDVSLPVDFFDTEGTDYQNYEAEHHHLRHHRHNGVLHQDIPWPVKKEAIVEGDIILGGLMMVHERKDNVTCGPVMPQGGIQALEAMLYTLDRLNNHPNKLLPNVTLGAHILDDCDKDTYGLEMAVDFIKG